MLFGEPVGVDRHARGGVARRNFARDLPGTVGNEAGVGDDALDEAEPLEPPGGDARRFVAEPGDRLLHRFLQRYIAEGNTRPLDAILIDDLAVRPDSLKNELADIVSVMNESSMTFGRLISRNFVFLDTFDSVADYCYALLRENNLFTHNIAKPQVSIYRPVRKPESGDRSIILIPGSYVQN